MNRRAFLLGCIATPIAAKVDAVSAARRPEWVEGVRHVATVSDISAAQEFINNLMWRVCETMEYKRAEFDLITYGQSTFNVAKAVAEIAPLDRPGEPCDAGSASRDQIG